MIGKAEQKKLAGALAKAKSRTERTKLVSGYAAKWGLAPATIYRHARAGGWESGRARRSDDGRSATPELMPEHFALVANYLTGPQRRAKKPPVDKAIMSCEQAGKIPAGRMTSGMFYRWAQRNLFDWRGDWSKTRMRDTYVNLRAEHPNHVHQIDASVYALWYVRGSGRLDLTGNEKTSYKNKPNDGRTRVIRWIVCDMLSGAFHVEYTSDESTVSLAKVLYEAWQRKARYDIAPFCGVPKNIYWDLHGTHWSEEIQHLLEQIGVECIPTRPHQPRSHGAVESTHGMWERWFELDQVMDPPATIEALQERADAMCAFLNSARPHSRYGRSRSAAWHEWMAANPAELRLPVPWEIFRRLVVREKDRLVRGDGTISFDGQKFRLPRELWAAWAGKRVPIHVSPFEEGWIDVHCGKQLVSLPALQMDKWGKPADANIIGGPIKASPGTPREAAVRHARKATSVEGIGAGGGGEVTARFEAIVPPMSLAHYEEVKERSYSEVEARQRITSEFTTLTPVQRAVVAAVTGAQTETQIADAIERIEQLAG